MIEFKRDEYREVRGSYSRFLEIHCERCDALLAIYQKDGPGNLRRMYLDRIIAPKVKKAKEFTCSKCHKILGTFIMFEKENRPAIRLYQDAVTKKVISEKSAARQIVKGVI